MVTWPPKPLGHSLVTLLSLIGWLSKTPPLASAIGYSNRYSSDISPADPWVIRSNLPLLTPTPSYKLLPIRHIYITILLFYSYTYLFLFYIILCLLLFLSFLLFPSKYLNLIYLITPGTYKTVTQDSTFI